MNLKIKVSSSLDTRIPKEKLKEILFETMQKIETLAVQKAPVDAGTLKNAITLIPSTPGQTEYVLDAGTNYASYVEFGTAPHFPPIEELKKWARRKLKDENLAWPVALKIARYGTVGQPFFRPAIREVKEIYLPDIARRTFS